MLTDAAALKQSLTLNGQCTAMYGARSNLSKERGNVVVVAILLYSVLRGFTRKRWKYFKVTKARTVEGVDDMARKNIEMSNSEHPCTTIRV
jgi:hypothetical protein